MKEIDTKKDRGRRQIRRLVCSRVDKGIRAYQWEREAEAYLPKHDVYIDLSFHLLSVASKTQHEYSLVAYLSSPSLSPNPHETSL